MAQPQFKPQREARDWPFHVTPLHPALGCEITGITLAEAVSPAMFAKVYEAFLDYELILFRDVDLPPATYPRASKLARSFPDSFTFCAAVWTKSAPAQMVRSKARTC